MRKRTLSETKAPTFYSTPTKPKSFENSNMSQIKANFDSKIKKQISICQSLLKNNEPQRCLDHSIMFSLFCTSCRRAICASCLYKNQEHKRHHVVPLEKASDMISEIIVKSEEKLSRAINQLNQIKYKNEQSLAKILLEHKGLENLLDRSYEDLLDLVRLKKKMHLKQLSMIKNEAEKKIRLHSIFVSQIHQYISIKKNDALLNLRKSQDLLFSFNIFMTLTSFKIDNITPKFSGMEIDSKKIVQTFNDIKEKLDIILSRKVDNNQTKNSLQLKIQRSIGALPKINFKQEAKGISSNSSKKAI